MYMIVFYAGYSVWICVYAMINIYAYFFLWITHNTISYITPFYLYIRLYTQASGFKMIVTDDLEDAATKAVHIANIVRQAEEVSLGVQFTAEPVVA